MFNTILWSLKTSQHCQIIFSVMNLSDFVFFIKGEYASELADRV